MYTKKQSDNNNRYLIMQLLVTAKVILLRTQCVTNVNCYPQLWPQCCAEGMESKQLTVLYCSDALLRSATTCVTALT